MTGERQHRNRGIGRDAVHLAIDDYSRVSLSKVLPEEADRCVTQSCAACHCARLACASTG